MIAASLLACHSASALRMGSVGTRLARVDPAVWTAAAAGIAATTRLQREAVSKAVATDKSFGIPATAFERNMEAMGTVLRSIQGAYSRFFGLGVLARAWFELGHLLATACFAESAASFSGEGPLWPKVTRLLAGSAASCSVMGVRVGMTVATCVLGFLGPGRLVFA